MTIRRASGTIHNASDDKSYGHNHMEDMNSEKYSRGRRGAPAKGVGRETGARVQIPLSPLLFSKWLFFCPSGKKIKLIIKSCWQEEITVIWLIPAGANEFQQNKKLEKSCWQIRKSMLTYKSCCWENTTTKLQKSF